MKIKNLFIPIITLITFYSQFPPIIAMESECPKSSDVKICGKYLILKYKYEVSTENKDFYEGQTVYQIARESEDEDYMVLLEKPNSSFKATIKILRHYLTNEIGSENVTLLSDEKTFPKISKKLMESFYYERFTTAELKEINKIKSSFNTFFSDDSEYI